MIRKISNLVFISLLLTAMLSCNNESKKAEEKNPTKSTISEMQKKVDTYVPFKLTADISHLSDNEKEMLKLLFVTAQLMDEIFWLQNYADKDELLNTIEDEATKQFVMINYGPWDEMDNLKPFVDGIGPKPDGCEFYPHDMTKEEFEAYEDPNKSSLYTVIRRDENGNLKTVWYHEEYKEQVTKASELLRKASTLAGDPEFAH